MNLSFFNKASNGMKVSNRNKSYGFTIVELLVVIVVIAILAAITIVSYTGISQKATASSLQSDLSNASKKLKMYYVEYSSYPEDMTSTDGNVTYCPTAPTIDNNYCIKPSTGNIFDYNSPGPSYTTYSLTATHEISSSTYKITNDTSPIVYNPVDCTGGTITTNGSYNVHKFTTVGTSNIVCSGNIAGAEVLIVAGGGGGASNAGGPGSGGGGGGGLIQTNVDISGTMSVVVGSGGNNQNADNSGAATNGGNSSFAGLTAIGGGRGGFAGSAGYSGGSGGGGTWNSIGGLGTNGQGYNGGDSLFYLGNYVYGGGGGGGAGGNGGLSGISGGKPDIYWPGDGGSGINSDIIQNGVFVGYAGGGGGGARYGRYSTATHGGGYSLASADATSGTSNTGGGGGGAHQGYNSGLGGSGIVIVRYLAQ